MCLEQGKVDILVLRLTMLHAAVLSELRPDLVWEYAARGRPVQDLVKVTFLNQITFTDGHIFVPFLPTFSRIAD